MPSRANRPRQFRIAEAGRPHPRQLGVERIALIMALRSPHREEDRALAQPVEERRLPQLTVEVAHVEAGLRSFDRTMPEEINRVLTDQLSDLLFTHSPEAIENLVREGIGSELLSVICVMRPVEVKRILS